MRIRALCILAIVIFLTWWAIATLQQRYQLLSRISSDCTVAHRARNWTELELLARNWLRIEQVPAAHYWLGIALKEQRRFDDAYHEFDAVPFDGPRGLDAAEEKMEIQFHIHQKPIEAIELAEKLLARDKKLASPRRHLIYFHTMMLHRAAAIRNIKLAIEYHVDIPEHYTYLMTMEDVGFRDAEEVTRKWMAANPDAVEFKNVNTSIRLRFFRTIRLKSAPIKEGDDQFVELRVTAVPELQALGSDPVALDTLLLLAMDDGDVAEAGRLLSLVPDSAADEPCFWRYRGWYAMRSHDLDEAESAYRRALDIHPLGFQSRNEFANTLRLKGRIDEAAQQQRIAKTGADLLGEIRMLTHAQHVGLTLLKKLASYAIDCGAPDLANGILRHHVGMSGSGSAG